jgi:hypothetical protein
MLWLPIVATSSSNNSDIFERAQSVISTVCEVLSDYGLETNFSAGKTEVDFDIFGAGSVVLKHQLTDMGRTLPVLVQGVLVNVRCVVQYDHLGTVCSSDGNMMPEIRKRRRVTEGAITDINAAMWKTGHISLKAKMHLHHMLLLSKLLYKSHVWLPLSAAQADAPRKPHLRILRLVSGKKRHEEHVSNAYLMTMEGVCDLSVYMRKQRLCYFSRVVNKGPKVLQALIQFTADMTGSWAGLVCEDLVWLRARCQKLDQIECLPEAFPAYAQVLVSQFPRPWANIVKKTVRSIELNSIPSGAVGLDKSFVQQADQEFMCQHCFREFPTKQGLTMHARLWHDYRSPATWFGYADGQCRHCRRQFFTRPRLINHLREGHMRNGPNSCLAKLQLEGGALSVQELAEHDASDRALRKANRARGRSVTFADCPCKDA